MSKVLPRYKAIKQHLEQGIRQRRWSSGDRLPTEMELAQQFGVSRMTANKAVQELVADGVLVRHQGMGTFVAELQAESPLLELRNIADEIRARGHQHSSQLHFLGRVAAEADVARRLGVAPGSELYVSKIVHRENGLPIQFEVRYVTPARAPDYLQQDFSQQTPNQYLSALYPLPELEHVVEAVNGNATECELLGIGAGEPCLLVHRRTWAGQQLISYARLLHPGSRYRLRSRSGI